MSVSFFEGLLLNFLGPVIHIWHLLQVTRCPGEVKIGGSW